MGSLKDHTQHLPQNSGLRTLVFWQWVKWSVPEPAEFWLFRGVTNEITAPKRGLVLSSLSTILNHKSLLAAWHRAGVLISCSPSLRIHSSSQLGLHRTEEQRKNTENIQSGTNVTLLSEIAELPCACLPSLTTALQAFKDGCVASRDWAVHPDFQTPSAWVPGIKRCRASSDLDQAHGSWGDLQDWAIGILGSVKLHSHSLVSAWMCDILRKNTGSEKRAQQSGYTQRTRQIPLGCFQVTCQV